MVLVLLLNPGFSPDDRATHADDGFRSRVLSSLRDGKTTHHYLEPTASGPGRDWWTRVTRHLTEAVGTEMIREQLLAVQYLPYHSKRFAHSTLRLPSQAYGFALVRRAMERGAFIVCARAFRHWCEAIPELSSYSKLVRLRNPRNVVLSPGNLDSFEVLVAALKATSKRPNQAVQRTRFARR